MSWLRSSHKRRKTLTDFQNPEKNLSVNDRSLGGKLKASTNQQKQFNIQNNKYCTNQRIAMHF